MPNWQKRVLGVLMAVALMGGSVAHAESAPEDADAHLAQLIEALKGGEHDDFISNGNDAFQSNLSETMFDSVQQHLGRRFADGYELRYLSKIDQYGMAVHVWSIHFEDGEGDLITRLAIDPRGEIGGIWFH
ncbi:hypothetical protein M0534_11310 [Methylonatrum kenyense]|uniref:hypothetical protein n=1 Tax=Methylonatrum kenyense TaxID=455253 RepID=UPI0020BDEDF5|nr:hypothetical protein [Methylonatrum kenyense]MCK8516907.1 hypothetical protein [Methylonatrum kenyense]